MRGNPVVKCIKGPIVIAVGGEDLCMSETVYIGTDRLLGEVIRITKEQGHQKAVIQVFEETSGLKPGAEVITTGLPLSIALGPGCLSGIFDGIGRSLTAIEHKTGVFISKGVHESGIDSAKQWETKVLIKEGQKVKGGDIAFETRETSAIVHKSMIHPYINGIVSSVKTDGMYSADDVLAVVIDAHGVSHDVKLSQKWAIKTPRPYKSRRMVSAPLITGQRVIDTFFPIGKGGIAAVPGGFGTGKTQTQHSIAKWADADVIVYIGCGERGNEMTQVLEEFQSLIDPRSNRPLTERTVLIANTSNMPVAAREASIYTGVTIAEYYRDMGYHTAILADSTSRWAEALRELSGRLEEMPAEEGYPAYLGSRLAGFYERAGNTENSNGSLGSVTIIGAVSPQGGDFSEPVTQNTKQLVRTFWTLDRALAYSRHFPAINWLSSYSEYLEDMEKWYEINAGQEFLEYRARLLDILHEESELMEIVKLIGQDVLPGSQRLILETARVIRLGFLQQNAFHQIDSYVPLRKQLQMMEVILYLYEKAKKLVDMGIPVRVLRQEDIFASIINMKYDIGNGENNIGMFKELTRKIDVFYDKVLKAYEG